MQNVLYTIPSKIEVKCKTHQNVPYTPIIECYLVVLKGIATSFPLAGIDSMFKFLLTCSPLTYSMALDAYHIDSVNTRYD